LAESVRICLVGCGRMGLRHLAGLAALSGTPFGNVELAAVCDLGREAAEATADKAEELLGARPEVLTDLQDARRLDLHAVDVVTDPSTHHQLVCQAIDLGYHVLVEKPLGVTVGACRRMVDAAAQHGCLLSVGENYRRDPSARLVHHLLHEDAIGRPYLAWCHSLGGGDGVYLTPWRHLRERGGLVLDMGIHFADLIRYQLGDIASVSGEAWIAAPVRRTGETEVRATAEDGSAALFRMQSGAAVSWLMGRGGLGGCSGQLIRGDRGVLNGFGTRGGAASMRQAGGEEMDHQELVQSAPRFQLDPLAAHLFPDRVACGNTDAKLLALELHELADAILTGRRLEVDGSEGLKDVAAIYAILESSLAGREVTMQEVESCELYDYQRDIDRALGLS
jgi:predicted dehydrogenase